MLLQSATMVAKKVLVNDKITACLKQIYLLCVYVKFLIEKPCPVKHFAFLKSVGYQYLNFVLRVTYCFLYDLLIGPQPTFLECIFIFL